LKTADGFTDADAEALREAGRMLPAQADALFAHWQGIGPLFVSAFAWADGSPDEAYLQAAHARLVPWHGDTCMRPIRRSHHRFGRRRGGHPAVFHGPARLMVLYAAWILFATALNAWVWWLNRT
jgi:hypothetical protein